MTRDTGLELAQGRDEFADAHFAFDGQEGQHASPRGVTDQVHVRAHADNITPSVYKAAHMQLTAVNNTVNRNRGREPAA